MCSRCGWQHWWVWKSWPSLQSEDCWWKEMIRYNTKGDIPLLAVSQFKNISDLVWFLCEHVHRVHRMSTRCGRALTSAFLFRLSASASVYSMSNTSSLPESSSEQSSSGRELLNSVGGDGGVGRIYIVTVESDSLNCIIISWEDSSQVVSLEAVRFSTF